MFFYKTPRLIKWLYPQLIWSVDSTDKIIYLTFDDGPIPGLTDFILDTLEAFEAKATFFCVGDNLKKHGNIAVKICDKGHALGNHTFNHLKGWSTSTEEYLNNIHKCDEQLRLFIQKPLLFRPPYGKIKRSQIRSVAPSHKIVMWDVLTGDYSDKIEPSQCLNNSVSVTVPGSIVLFHDNKKAEKNVKFALPRYLDHFKKEGYQFHSLWV